MSDFDVKSLRSIKIKNNKTLFKNDSVEYFKDPQRVVESLAEAMLEGDKEAFYEIFCGYLSVVNKEELSRRSKVPIATIRRMASGSNFNIENMLKLTSALKDGKKNSVGF